MHCHSTPIEKTCLICGAVFRVRPYKANTAKYCSNACRYEARRGKWARGGGVPLICAHCGKAFRVKPYRGSTQRYCSPQCEGAARRGKRGEDPTAKYSYADRRHGYIYVYRPEHPDANVRGYIAEHRLVAEQTIGRPLKRSEIVHHVDGNGANNSPDNLQVMTRREHALLHRAQGDF